VASLKDVDWDARRRELDVLLERTKKDNHSGYDCLIGVSGGKDSTRQAMYVRDTLGLKPLLVCCSYPPEQLTERGAHNLSNLISLGFDTITVSPDPITWKKLMRQGFFTWGNWAKSTETALYATLPRISIAYHTPLAFLGENPATQMGDLATGSLNWDANKMKNTNTIKEGHTIYLGDGVGPQDLIAYEYPSDDEMAWANLQVAYLGYFWPNFTKVDNAAFAMAHGLEVRTDTPEERGALHPSESLDEDFVFVNQMIKYFKYGFGKVTDEVSEMIRYGRMTREEGLDLVRKYDGKCSAEYIRRFCGYIEISEKEFWEVAEKYRNKDLFEKTPDGWQLKALLHA
jgi:N-acetyl sugar amidotransferase